MLTGEVIWREVISLVDPWSSKAWTVPEISTVLKNKVLVLGGLYVGGPWLPGVYIPCVETLQTNINAKSRMNLTILS